MIIRLDGAMGTELQKRGLASGEPPELWNLTHPEEVISVHRSYLEAGAEIITANTFGANPAKYHDDLPLAKIIPAAIRCAREAGAKRIALDVGPTGRLLKTAGDYEFDAAYEAFAQEIRLGVEAGADLIHLETFNDTFELKAALLAAKENSSLPILASVALDENGKLLTGADVETIAALFNALKPTAAGFNCGLGPDHLLPFVKRLAARTQLPIIVKANAGLPSIVNGQTVYPTDPETFARDISACIEAGATYVGGCCGTTPRHLRAVSDIVQGMGDRQQANRPSPPPVVSSYSRTVELSMNDSLVIGERINPTGKKKLREAYQTGDTAYILREALAQVDAGASILDVNAGVPGLDEKSVLRKTIEAIQSVTDTPLQIDTASPAALEEALRHYNGVALVNSVNAKAESMAAVFPLVKKYGGIVVALTLDEHGIPTTAKGRLALARKILARGAEYGLTKDDFVFDVLTLAVSAEPDSARVILESLRLIRSELGVRTALGVSNISFGLPARPLLNASFYTLALEAGLNAAIVNPLSTEMMNAYRAWRALSGRDQACSEWIGANQENSSPATAPTFEADLGSAILRGLQADAAAQAQAALAAGCEPLELINREIVPALEAVGRNFESGKAFLPQLLRSAEAAASAFEIVRAAFERSGEKQTKRGPIILATVKGDIHDIGKNIVKALLENYNFEVIDLGKDVDPAEVVRAAIDSHAKLVGLSALMTTTLDAMQATIQALNAAVPSVQIMVGGAVLTETYAKEIGATYYAKDAMASVRIAESVL